MRDTVRMLDLEAAIRASGGVIQKERIVRGYYWCNAVSVLPSQIVSDMIADGWLVVADDGMSARLKEKGV